MRSFLGFAALLLMIATVYAADDWPSLKEGFWSIHRETTDEPGNKKTIQDQWICRNHASDEKARARAEAMLKNCKTNLENHVGSKYETERECVVAGTTIHSKSTISVSGDSEFHSEETTTYTPAMADTTKTTMIVDQKYVGACPPGMEPGDIKGADGNIRHSGRR